MRRSIDSPTSLITGNNRSYQLLNDFLPTTRLILPKPPPVTDFFVPYVAKFSPHDLLRIATAGEGGRLAFIRGDIAVQNDSQFLPINTAVVAGNAIYDLTFLPDPSVICIGSGDQTVRFIDTTTFKVVNTYSYHKGTPQTLCPFNDGVLSGGKDGQVCFWDRRAPSPNFSIQMKNSASVSSVVSPTHDIFITGDSHGKIFAWDPRSPKTPFFVPIQKTETKNPIINLSLSPNGKMMAALTANNTLNIYSLDGYWRYVSQQWPKIGAFYGRTCFSPDSKYIITGSGNYAVCMFSVALDRDPNLLLGHSSPVTCVEWCKDVFEILLSCSDDKTIQIWIASSELAPEKEPEIEPFVSSDQSGNQEKPPSVTKVYTLHHFL
ncbi:hypothetical protein TRFO_20839 [Tritrichomonas foetus]|uniref:Uncharacterized protein n=1 Tax=Tritrichomonas foetus TaxID=1144522 RepID=A0A1J4KJN3_9EUKA|nr:hypothetical protein TRFO_20839 [Tritrichomonas foetus]|eukprot:OHT10036.1 hypothetical protein TRFO_20839 [Tritrichomonas foetus]